MKKKIEAELKKLAENIIKNSNQYDTVQLKEQARDLYEKLSILAFTEKNLKLLVEDKQVVKHEVKKPSKMKPEPLPVQTKLDVEPTHDDFAPDGTVYNDEEITEPNTEKIKDIVAQMPPETESIDRIMNKMNEAPSPTTKKPAAPKEDQSDFRNIGVDYDNLPSFEPLNNRQKENKPKSLNDRLKKGINIGLNERLTYIKHLFAGNTSDYNRVLSQLNTFGSLEEAHKFILKVVKPDYGHWEGKEEYEQRFMEVIESKFTK